MKKVTNLKVHKYLAGPLGGKQQLGAQIAQNDIDALIFLREPSNPKPHDPDLNDVILCATLIIFRWQRILQQQNYYLSN